MFFCLSSATPIEKKNGTCRKKQLYGSYTRATHKGSRYGPAKPPTKTRVNCTLRPSICQRVSRVGGSREFFFFFFQRRWWTLHRRGWRIFYSVVFRLERRRRTLLMYTLVAGWSDGNLWRLFDDYRWDVALGSFFLQFGRAWVDFWYFENGAEEAVTGIDE